jgi:hypothetical protein
MRDAAIYLEWKRDAAGYELLPEVPAPVLVPEEHALSLYATGQPARVVPRGGQPIAYEPLELDRLYSRFAALRTPEGVLAFICKYGPLTERGADASIGENVSNVLDHAAAFRSFLTYEDEHGDLASWAGAEGQLLGRLELRLARDVASGSLRMQLKPPTLLAALWLQLAQKLTGNRPFRECPYCLNWFETGPGKGRRLDARFCIDDHRVLFNSRKRSKGRVEIA